MHGLAILVKRRHIHQATLDRWEKKYPYLTISVAYYHKLIISGLRDDIQNFYENHSKYFRLWAFEAGDSQILAGAVLMKVFDDPI
jgi:hypothetical protein